MYAIRLLFWMHFLSAVLIPFYRDWGGLSFSRILLLNAWLMLWMFLLEVPTGTVADFLGRKVSIALAFVVNMIGIVVYLQRPDFYNFLFAEALLACAMTLLSGADEALVYDSLQEEAGGDIAVLDARAKIVIPRLESWKLAGILIGAPIGSLIASHYSVTTPLRSHLVPLTLGLLLSLTLHEPSGGGPSRGGDSREPYARILLSGVRYFAGHPLLRILTLDMVTQASLSWLIIWTYQPFLEMSGVGIAYFGPVHVGLVLAQIVFLTLAPRLEKVLGSQKRLLLVGPAVAGVAFIVLGLNRSLVVVLPAILLIGGFGLSRPPLFGAYLNRHIPSDKRATVLSTVSMARTIAIAVVNPIVGFFADRSLTWTAVGLGVAHLALLFVSGVDEEHLAARSAS